MVQLFRLSTPIIPKSISGIWYITIYSGTGTKVEAANHEFLGYQPIFFHTCIGCELVVGSPAAIGGNGERKYQEDDENRETFF